MKNNELQDQRYTYEIAKSQLKRKDYKAYLESRKRVGDYPLATYLDYQYTSHALNPLNKSAVETFIEQHKGTYLGDRMHRRYLHKLSQTKDHAGLVYWYSDEIASKKITCSWLASRIALGDKSVLDKVDELWVAAKSQPEECDPVFATWFTSEQYRDIYAWQRFLLASMSGNRSLARYVASKIPAQTYQHYIDLVWELEAQPHKIRQRNRFKKHTPEMHQVIAFGIRKYARQNPVKALQIWEQYEASAIFDEALTQEVKIDLVNKLLQKKKMAHVESILASTPSIRQAKVIERLIRAQLREKRWSDVLDSISLLPLKDQQSERWQYWRLRADLALDYMTKASALKGFEALAQKRSFYGFLSADILSKPYSLEHQPARFPETALKSLALRPAFQRAKELWLTGHVSEAHAEWYYGLDKLSARELAAAGVLAHKWGWYDRGIQAMIAGKHWNHLDVRFPFAYKNQILAAADETDLTAPFIFAVARQESAMSEQAKSPAGARGVMQLMPTTAKQTAKRRGIHHTIDDLFNADHNIQLGSQYLDELLSKFNGNRILAAAAYNAGPHRVDRWTSDNQRLDFDIWIETIPFRETRGYVQNVLTYAVIYSIRMGTPAQLVTKSEANQKL